MMGVATVVVVVLYFSVLAGIAYWAARKNLPNPEDFFIGGRSIGTLAFVLTVTATFYSMYSFIGAYGLTWRLGINFLVQGWWMLVWIGWTVYAFGSRFWLLGRRFRCITPADLLATYYGSETVRILVVLICVIGVFPYALIQFIGAGKTISSFTGGAISYAFGIFLFLVIVGAYVVLGGFRAVVWSDVFQGLFFGAIMLVTPIWLIVKIGGLGAFFSELAVVKPHLLTFQDDSWPWFLRLSLIWGLGFLFLPHIWQRMYAARDLKTIHRGALWIPVWSFVLTLPIMLVGLMGHRLLPDLTDQTSDMLIPILFKTYAPLLGMFLVAAAFAAGMSTVDSMLLSVSSIFEEDIYRRFIDPNASEARRTWMGKLFIILFVLLLVWFSFSEIAQGFLTPIADKGGELACMLLPATLGPLFWPRATRQGAIASLASGFLVICLSMIPQVSALLPKTGHLHYSIIVGLLVSFGMLFGVSMITKPLPYSKQEAFHGHIDSVLYESQVATEGAYDPQTA